MSQTETPFLGSRSARKAFEAKQILDLAEDAGREPTADERSRVKQLLDDAEVDHATEKKMTQLGRELGAPELVPDSPFGLAALSPGEGFTKSQGYKSIVGNRGERWSTGMIEVGETRQVPLAMKGTLLEGGGAPGSGTGGGWLTAPTVAPGTSRSCSNRWCSRAC